MQDGNNTLAERAYAEAIAAQTIGIVALIEAIKRPQAEQLLSTVIERADIVGAILEGQGMNFAASQHLSPLMRETLEAALHRSAQHLRQLAALQAKSG